MTEKTPYVPLPMPERSLCNENGTLTVTGGVGGTLNSYVSFAETVEVLNRFECRLVNLTLYAGDVVDFAKIKRPDRIRRLSINFFERRIDCIVPADGAGLSALTDLTVIGNIPKRFLDFSKLPALKLLDIDYQVPHLGWLQHWSAGIESAWLQRARLARVFRPNELAASSTIAWQHRVIEWH